MPVRVREGIHKPAAKASASLRLSSAARTKLRFARVGRFTTIDSQGYPHAVPVCFVYNGRYFYLPIDRKPKRVAPGKLARLRNIGQNSRVALLVDHYEEKWSELWFVLVRGRAALVAESARAERARAIRALKKKYGQYRSGMLADDAILIRIRPDKISSWIAAAPGEKVT
jgi:PPOX class probable F420-dependent enzyme